MIGLFGDGPTTPHKCSRANCQHEAGWAILWRNPKIHATDRRKTWLACEEHRAYLQEFLEARSFPLEVLSLEELLKRTPQESQPIEKSRRPE